MCLSQAHSRAFEGMPVPNSCSCKSGPSVSNRIPKALRISWAQQGTMPPAQRRPSDASSRHRRLLLLVCSDRTRSGGRLTAALERYDGPQFRSLRHLRAAGLLPVDLVIRIVSAKYGLLRPEDKIANYDRRLNPALALNAIGLLVAFPGIWHLGPWRPNSDAR